MPFLAEPTPELVERLRNLVRRYDSDVRILMPIISGLTKEECLDLVPKFVLSSTCLRNVPTFYKKMLRSIGMFLKTTELYWVFQILERSNH